MNSAFKSQYQQVTKNENFEFTRSVIELDAYDSHEISGIILLSKFEHSYEDNMSHKVALITGITGQDGAYRADFLLSEDYKIHGI